MKSGTFSDAIKRVVANHQYEDLKFPDGKLRMDGTTAHMLLTVYNVLNADAKIKFDTFATSKKNAIKVVDWGWKQVGPAQNAPSSTHVKKYQQARKDVIEREAAGDRDQSIWSSGRAFGHRESMSREDKKRIDSGKLDNPVSIDYVLFRRFKDGKKEVIAFLPGQTVSRGMIMSYMHIGQHGEADPGIIAKITRPVEISEPDVKDLYDELVSRGYKNLKVIKNLSPAMIQSGWVDARNNAPLKGNPLDPSDVLYVRYKGKCWIESGRRDRRGWFDLVDIRDRSKGILADPAYVHACKPEDVAAIKRIWKDPIIDKPLKGNPPMRYLPVSEGKRLGIGRFLSFSSSGSISGMKKKFYGEDARLVKSGSYIYNVTDGGEEIWNVAGNKFLQRRNPATLDPRGYRPIKPTPALLAKIKKHAMGSMYRMNAKTANYYSFTVVRDKQGKLDWQGGWSWRKGEDNEDWLLNLSTGKIEENVMQPNPASTTGLKCSRCGHAIYKVKGQLKCMCVKPSPTKMKNPAPRGAVKIYDQIEAIEAIKDDNSLWPGQPFRHDFKKGSAAEIFGMPDGSLMVKSKKGKPLWKNFNYPEKKRRKMGNPWKGKLRKEYADFDEWKRYSDMYGLAKRLGFSSARAAWDANPTIQGSTDPKDYRVVGAGRKK